MLKQIMRHYSFFIFPIFLGLQVFPSSQEALAQGVWTTKAPMPTSRQGLGAAVVNNKLYVFGGAADAFQVVNTVEAYEPVHETGARSVDTAIRRRLSCFFSFFSFLGKSQLLNCMVFTSENVYRTLSSS
jgi:hypothetical protein